MYRKRFCVVGIS